jgi:hypothetical protein
MDQQQQHGGLANIAQAASQHLWLPVQARVGKSATNRDALSAVLVMLTACLLALLLHCSLIAEDTNQYGQDR